MEYVIKKLILNYMVFIFISIQTKIMMNLFGGGGLSYWTATNKVRIEKCMILCVNTFMHSIQNTAKFINATLGDYTLLKCPTMSVLKHNKVKKKKQL